MRDPCSGLTVLRRVLLAAVVAACALAVFSPAARADGDPGSDVLVYQNLFVAGDANMPIAEQVRLGNLLTAAADDAFPVRVAVIAKQDDLGAVTALWGKPAAYASFLGTELSLAYTGRLLVVMPNGFGFYWHGHPTAAAYQVLAGQPTGADGNSMGTVAESAVRALAAAAGVRLTPQNAPAAPGADPAFTGAAQPAGHPAASAASSTAPVVIAVVAALVVLAVGAAGILLARRAGVRLSRPSALRGLRGRRGLRGLRLPRLRRPRLAIPGTWLAGGFVGVAVLAIVLHAVTQPSAGPSQSGTAAQMSALEANANLDPGVSLNQVAPDFTLTDQFGQPVSLSAYRGKVVVVAFNDSECSSVCPLTSTALLGAKSMLGASASQVQLLGINANPKATSIEDVRSYSELHGMLYQWRYLTGSLTQLQSVWKAYSIGVTVNVNQIDHEPAVFVINQQGRLVKLFLTQMAYSAVGQLGQLYAQEIASLLPNHPAVNSHLSYLQVRGVSPATNSSLPQAGGGYVSLGPGQPGQGSPRLYLFFATWDQEITTLGGQLDALNGYQSAASAGGLPGLTAIDEGSVEPSASALPDFLNTLRQPLSYPVGIDDTGQVGDGYEVQGAPWFVLTSADGKIVWTWEVSVSGWPSTAALGSHVRTALAAAAKSHS